MTDRLPGDAPQPRTSVGRSSLIMASGTTVSRVLGFVKTILLTLTLGHTTNAADAFTQANMLPNYLYQLTVGGVLTAVLVPQITKAIRGTDRGQAYVNKVATLALIVFTFLTGALTVLAPWLIRLYTDNWSDDRLALTVALAYWCVPQIFFYALFSLIGGILNAHRVFGPYMWAPALNNIVAIVGLLAFLLLFGADPTGTIPVVDWTPGKIALLGGSSTLGVAVQALSLLYFWKKTGLSYRPDFRFRGVGLGSTIRAAGWILGTVLLSSLQTLIQTRVLSGASADRGVGDVSLAGVTTYEYAALIFMLPHSIVAVSIVTVYFTQMSEHAAAGRLRAFADDYSSGLRHIGLATVFSSIMLVVLSFPVARFFSPDSFSTVTAFALVLTTLAPALPFMSAVFLTTRALYALNDTRSPFLVTLSKFVLIVPGYLLVMRLPESFWAVGVGLMQVAMLSYEAVFLWIVLRRRAAHLDGARTLRSHVRFLVASLVAGAIGTLVVWALGAFSPTGWMESSKLAAVLGSLVAAAVAGATYLGLLRAMRVSELAGFTSILGRKFGRRRG